jgi:hypothetical protein
VVEAPLRFFQIKDEILRAYAFVLQDKCFKIIPECRNGILRLGEFGDFIEIEIFQKKSFFLVVCRIEMISLYGGHHKVIDFVIVRERKEMLEFVYVVLDVQAFWQIKIFVITCHSVIVLLKGYIGLQSYLSSELFVMFLYGDEVHSCLSGCLSGIEPPGKESEEFLFPFYFFQRKSSFAFTAFTLAVLKFVSIGMITIDTFHTKL